MTEIYVGASKGFIHNLVQLRRSTGHQVICISSSSPATSDDIQVNWDTLDSADIHKICKDLPKTDLLFFNQKSSSLSDNSFAPDNFKTLELWKHTKHWTRSYFLSCIMPFELIHGLGTKLSNQSRVGWMLSSMILHHRNNFQYADYIGQKFQNYLLMKNFAQYHPACFFGINPENISTEVYGSKLDNFLKIVSKPCDEINGKVWHLDSMLPDEITINLG